MKQQTVGEHADLVDGHIGKLYFNLGVLLFEDKFNIQCTNENNSTLPHRIFKNGNSANIKSKKQQFYCKTCGSYFFIHKCKYFQQFEKDIKPRFMEKIALGHIGGKNLAELFH
jgi:hypothetical protein